MALIRDKTTQEIADLLDVEPRTIQNWVKAGCPCTKATKKSQSHKFNESEVCLWMRERGLSGKIGRPTDVSSEELNKWKIRKEAALALKAERENKVAEGKLIDAAEEQQRDIQKIITVRNCLCGLGASLSSQLEGLDGPERQSLIDSSIETILKELGT